MARGNCMAATRLIWSRITNSHRVRVVRYKGRAFGLRWKGLTGAREVSSRTTELREAERLAALLEADLAAGLIDAALLTWSQFRTRYEAEALPYLSTATASAWRTSANHYERVMEPKWLRDVTKSKLSAFMANLYADELSRASIRSYLAHLMAALSWACDVDLIPNVPRVKMPRGAALRRMRSRPITEDEFQAILNAVTLVRSDDPARWSRFLLGLWHSGLRVDELRRLSWDASSDLYLSTECGVPLIRMFAEGHKSRRDCYQPVTLEFWALAAVPPDRRHGPVFPLPGRSGQQMTSKRVVRTISAIGAASKVVTDARTGKLASSHDIGRRAFLTRLDSQLSIAELQKWARHASPDTTMSYYHHRSAIELAHKVGWTDDWDKPIKKCDDRQLLLWPDA